MMKSEAPNIRVDFSLRDAGWASCRIAVGEKSYTFESISYLTDALDDLLRAALMVATGSPSYTFHFEDEPGESRWILRTGLDNEQRREYLEITILEFDDAFQNQPIEKGKPVFNAKCAPDQFAYAVYETANIIWEKFGADGYDRKWTGQCGFPIRAFKALETALSLEAMPTRDESAAAITITRPKD